MKPPPPEIKAWVRAIVQVAAPCLGLFGIVVEVFSGTDRQNLLAACLILLGFPIAGWWDGKKKSDDS